MDTSVSPQIVTVYWALDGGSTTRAAVSGWSCKRDSRTSYTSRASHVPSR